MTLLPPTACLLLIDLQQAIDDPRWATAGPRNNPGAEVHVERLLDGWRRTGRPVIHVRHDSVNPDSTYRPGQPGHDFKPEVRPEPGEKIVGKETNSAFIGTGLEAHLHQCGIDMLVVAGVITNNSVEATVRMAGNLSFDTWLVADACFTFARHDLSGRLWRAEEVHALSLANLDGEYCTVTDTAAMLARLG